MKSEILIPAIIVIILLAVAFVGYLLLTSAPKSSPAAQNTPAPVPRAKATETVANQETIAQLQLQSVLKNFGPGKSIAISYFFASTENFGAFTTYSISAKTTNRWE